MAGTNESDITHGPNHLKGLVDCARSATLKRDWLGAYRCWDAVRTHYPDKSLAYLRCGAALRELGRLNEAEQLLESAVGRFPNDASLAILHASLANARRDWPAAMIRWKLARERFPENPWSYLGSIHALRASGDADEVATMLSKAETVLPVAKERGFDAMAARRVELEIARARVDWAAVKEAAQNIIAKEAEPSAQTLLVLAQACWHVENHEAADRAAEQALAADPGLSEAWLVRAWVATDQGDGEAALSYYRRLVELNPNTVRWLLKVVQLLNLLGHVKEAVHELKAISARWPDDPGVKMFVQNFGPAAGLKLDATSAADGAQDDATDQSVSSQALLARAPGAARRLRPLIDSDSGREVVVAELKHAATAVLVFTGMNDAVSIPLTIFDRFMAALPVTAIYLKDFNRLRYMVGVESLSHDYQGTILALRGMLRALGVTRLCTFGNCDGGFAAIRYGLELGAERIIAFAPATHTPQDAAAKFERGRNLKRLRFAERVTKEMSDLKPFIEAKLGGSQIELFYAEGDPRERMHALHLAGVAGVSLHVQPTPSDRQLLRQFALTRTDLCETLGTFFGVQPAAIG